MLPTTQPPLQWRVPLAKAPGYCHQNAEPDTRVGPTSKNTGWGVRRCRNGRVGRRCGLASGRCWTPASRAPASRPPLESVCKLPNTPKALLASCRQQNLSSVSGAQGHARAQMHKTYLGRPSQLQRPDAHFAKKTSHPRHSVAAVFF
jgi:hypothetical protein